MGLLEIIVLLLVISWLGGSAFHIGGDFVHIILVIIVVILLFNLLGR